jgi:predicted class III extradiol MEMO1 family dioxygenase
MFHSQKKSKTQFMKALDYEGFKSYIKKNFMNISGVDAIGLLFNLVKPTKLRLEQYYGSFDIIDETHPSIAYATMLVE